MVPLAADENVDGRVLRGLRLRLPHLDIVRVQDVGLGGEDDRNILAWAAGEDRVLLTHDVSTMTAFAGARLKAGEPMAGVVILPQTEAIGAVIAALRELIEGHEPGEMRSRILYLKP
jgi:predicted nuclease of predicted toxin-antitoxin system